MEDIAFEIYQARMLAEFLHNGQTYGDGEDYLKHLDDVFKILKEYEIADKNILASAYLHDAIEDTQANYKLIEKYFGKNIADIVYAVTNESGINRKERNSKTYQKIQNNDKAIILKLADRIANTRQSLNNIKFFNMYKKEFEVFKYFLYNENASKETLKMWEELEKLYQEN